MGAPGASPLGTRDSPASPSPFFLDIQTTALYSGVPALPGEGLLRLKVSRVPKGEAPGAPILCEEFGKYTGKWATRPEL